MSAMQDRGQSDASSISTNRRILAQGEVRESRQAFPELHNSEDVPSPSADVHKMREQEYRPKNDEEPAEPSPNPKATGTDLNTLISHGDAGSSGGSSGGLSHGRAAAQGNTAYRMQKYSLYETASRYYVVGVDASEKRYRILKIDRTTEGSELSVTDDKIVYSLKEMNQLLDTIHDGNRGTGGIKLRCMTWGIIGFIKFTGPFYMLLITKKSTVAMIGGHYIYQVEGTELVALTAGKSKPTSRNAEEQKYLSILNNLDLTKSFYYSYSYDVTRTLQHNIIKERSAMSDMWNASAKYDLNSMFVWNNYLLEPAVKILPDAYMWCRPIIHGYIDQSALSIYGRTAHVTVIARRSRHFAGARFLKRGANDLGYVANDVETEQIVSESLTTSFHAPGPRFYCSPQYTSYVQHRGSIPLYWTQDGTGVTPKPPIELNLVDPFYGAAALHFNNLFERYGAPIYVLNLIKAKERQPRESKLLEEYTHAIDYLNQFLPEPKKIIHKAWDMSRASKIRGGDVIGNLELIAESVVKATGFFHNGDGSSSAKTAQNGIARTNCIDCLDRTNAAQFVIGKCALGHQLHALGILDSTSVEYDTDAVNLFTHMWHDHGDTIAVQYGGSQLVNTMETYRKINQWTSHSRDMIESFKRYYNNSFLDSQRQEAYNLFLGNYVYSPGEPMLWDLATDYYLHHTNPRDWIDTRSDNYINWYAPKNLKRRKVPQCTKPNRDKGDAFIQSVDDYWLEYYRPAVLSSFPKLFAYKMNSTMKYIPLKSTQDGRYDLSPFRVRTDGELATDKRKPKAEQAYQNIILSPNRAENDAASVTSGKASARGMSLQRWLHPAQDRASAELVGRRNTIPEPDVKAKPTPLEKSKAAQWTFTKAVNDSLNPSVKEHEAEDYDRYIRHPQNLPLVVSTETPTDIDSSEYQEYVNIAQQDRAIAMIGFEDDIDLYEELLRVGEDPLTVTEGDAAKKRYKAYRKWLRGKSFFKQQPLD